jgi:PAS domain S-box-containing protein
MSKILIVEDHAESRYLLEQLLSSRGHQVAAAENGQEGLRLAREDPPDVIISDIMMPVMNGFKLCCEIKKDPDLRQTPFIFYTATFVDEDDRKLAMSLGASRFVVKPSEGDAFIRILDDVLKEHQNGILPVPEGPMEDQETLVEMYENSLTRKLAETVEKLQDERQALIQSERRLKEAQELAHIGHWELDLKAGSLQWSDELYRILGVKPRAFDPSYKTLLTMEVIHPEDRAGVIKAHKESLSKKTSCNIEYRLLLKDGTVKYVNERFQTIFDDEGMPACAMGTVQDITERREAEAALKEAESLYRIHFENVSDVIYSIDHELKLINISPSVERLLGYRPEELIGRSIQELNIVAPESMEQAISDAARILDGERIPAVEYRFMAHDGTVRWGEVSGAPLIREGHVTAMISVARDITERKEAEAERQRLEAQLLQAQKLEAVGRLAGGVAHDFNNLLTVILGYGEMVMEDLNPDHPHHSLLADIRDAGNRARNLTRQLLAFSRKQVLDVHVVDANDLVRGFERLMRRVIGEDVLLKLALHDHPALVKADISQLEQVLMNLAVNARDAMPEGGVLTIETGVTALEEDDVSDKSGFDPGPYVVIGVSDTGVGMDSQILGQIFEPFFTTKESDRGTGLGLATSYGIVKQHGGDIYVYSEPGQGTIFKVYLPVASEEQAPEPRVIERPKAKMGTGAILVVEDDPQVLRLAGDLLKAAGYEVLQAAGPDEALEQAGSHEGPIDLILADVILPGMKGPDMVEKVLKIHPHARVVFMSGYSEEVIAHKGILFLPKPFTVRGLREKVAEALGRL